MATEFDAAKAGAEAAAELAGDPHAQQVQQLVEQLMPLVVKRGVSVPVALEALLASYMNITAQVTFGHHPFSLSTRLDTAKYVVDTLEALQGQARMIYTTLQLNGEDGVRLLNEEAYQYSQAADAAKRRIIT